MLHPGLYESLLTERLRKLVAELPLEFTSEVDRVDAGEAHERLARHVYNTLNETMHGFRGDESERLQAQLSLCNAVLGVVAQQAPFLAVPERLLTGAIPLELLAVTPNELGFQKPSRPIVPLHTSALLVNDGERISIGASIKMELASADSVDLICAFVNHTGIRVLENELRALCGRGRLRLITTTYMGATQRKALDLLAAWGAEIKVTYELPPANTKLHAKAWLFHRNSGFHTAYIGSSNISHSALIDGLEWNVRLSQTDAAPILAKFVSTFERYWVDKTFESYDPEHDKDRLDRALRSSDRNSVDTLDIFVDLIAKPFQQDILEMLEVERKRHGKWRNLVVAATGTGKTVIAALDYKRLHQEWKSPSLLFVAHRREILDQAIKTYRLALRDGAFGEKWVDGERPSEYKHVFASIQTLANFDLKQIRRDHFDVVVVDEFHHAEATTYQRLLDYVQPNVLLGLTATPERADGRDVRDFFGGESTVELRLWDALDEGLLCPFQYFGIADNEDLSEVEWVAGKYSIDGLDNVFVTNGEARAALVFEQVNRIVTDWRAMRAIGFCVSVRHAEFMAERFSDFGVACMALSANTISDERRQAIRDLRSGKLNIVFAVDIFNEGIDLPEIDTVLFLRPTESATVYIQQLGRGLRLHDNKPCLTVLDFIGSQRKEFRFELRYRAMTGLSRTALQRQLEQGFPTLPAGCNIQLDRVAKETVLNNLRDALPTTPRRMIAELRDLAKGDERYQLATFLGETGLEPEDLYRNGRYYRQIKRQAGLIDSGPTDLETKLGRGMQRLLAVEDPERVRFYSRILRGLEPPVPGRLSVRERRSLYMLIYGLLLDFKLPELDAAVARFWQEESIHEEILELLSVLDKRSEVLPKPLEPPSLNSVPLNVHASYTKDEVMAAFEHSNPASMREGVHYFERDACDVFFITLRKSEHDYSPTTRYQDYVIAPDLFHWDSQSGLREGTKTAQRYINHDDVDSHILLMVRERKYLNGRTSPYVCLGTAQYVSHESEQPIKFIWRLDTPMPEAIYQQFKAAAG